MKKIILTIAFLFLTSTCFAELYIVIDKSTKQIITASEKNDTVLQEGQELVILPGGFKNYELTNFIGDYKLVNKNFVLNVDKVNEKIANKQKEEEKIVEQALIDKEIKNQTIKALKDKGVNLKHFKEE